MGLYERILRLEEPSIPVHQFVAALHEQRRGNVTGSQVRTMFNLSVAEGQEAQTLSNRIGDVLTPLTGDEVHEILCLAEFRMAPYDTVGAVKTRLGV